MTAWMRSIDVAGLAHASVFDAKSLAWQAECGARLAGKVESSIGQRCPTCDTIVLVSDERVAEAVRAGVHLVPAIAERLVMSRDIVHRALLRLRRARVVVERGDRWCAL